MTDTDRIDLSLPVNQNKIAVSLATFYTSEEIDSIELDKIRCPFDQLATNPCGCMEYHKSFDDGKEFILHCTIDTTVVPNTHYISIKLENSKLYNSEFKCNPNEKNVDYISYTIKKAVNYYKYKNIDDVFYTKQHLIRNFSNKMIKDIGDSIITYQDLKDKFLDIEKKCDEMNGIVDDDVVIEYTTSNSLVSVKAYTVDDKIFKFEYTNNITKAHDYCYFLRGHVGLDMLILAIDRCINKIRIDSMDESSF